METLREIDPWLFGGAALAALLFAVREVVAGLLRAVGADLWERLKRRRTR